MSYRSLPYDFSETLPAGSGILRYHDVFTITEPGKLVYLILHSDYKAVIWRIYIDGREFRNLKSHWEPEAMNEEMPDIKGGICLAGYDAVNDFYTIGISIPIKWETKLEVKARNPTTGNIIAAATLIYDRLSELPLPQPEHDVQRARVRPDPEM